MPHKVKSTEKDFSYFKNYEMKMQDITQHKDLRGLLKNYAVTVCRCPETFAFIEDCESFSSSKLSTAKRLQRAVEIFDAYIKPGALLEVNISNHEKKEIQQAITALSQQQKPEVPTTIFGKAKEVIYREFLIDVFPRFIRSEFFMNFVHEKGGEQFLKKVACKKSMPVAQSVKLASDEVTDCDLKFLTTLAQDDNVTWKMLASKDTSATYVSRIDFQIEKASKGERVYKCVGSLPYAVNDVLHTITNPAYRHLLTDNQLSRVEKVGLTPEQHSFSITHETYPLVWPLTNRDFVCANSVAYDTKEQTFFVVKKTTAHEKCPAKQGTIRGFCFGGWTLTRVSENKTRYIYSLSVDMKAKRSQPLFKMMMKKQFLSLHDGLLTAMRQAEKKQFEKASQTYGLLDTLEDQRKKTFFSTFSQELGITPTEQSSPLSRVSSLESISPIASPRTTEESPAFEKNLSSEKNLKRIMYISKYNLEFLTPADIQEIAKKSAENNKKRNVTGLLLSCGGVFYQVLEGKQEAVDDIYAIIQKDTRHSEVKCLKQELGISESERYYTAWAMHAVNLDEMDHFFANSIKKLIQNASSNSSESITEESTSVGQEQG